MGSGPWGIISVATASPSMPKDAPIESSRRATDSESSQTELDDLRDLRRPLAASGGGSPAAQDGVRSLFVFLGWPGGRVILLLVDPGARGGRWAAVGKQRVRA